MSEPLWGPRPPPETGPAAAPVGHWQPICPADLTMDRRDLATALHQAGDQVDVDSDAIEDAIERLLLAYEELASNALRHGREPVRVAVTAFGASWLLDVSDTAPERPPTPAVERDAAHGGLGLYLVARICASHGVMATDDGRKHVWARVDLAPATAPAGRGTASATLVE